MKPIQLLQLEGKDKYKFKIDELKAILLQPNIRDRAIVVISIAGPARRGKSFLLNFLLRYLKSKYNSTNFTETSWMGTPDEPLTGFPWCAGSERNTTGILIYPEPFLYDYPNGKKVAILIMDTQGTFDPKTSMDSNVKIFGLSTKISTLQIYNLTNNIQENDMQNLSLFAEYGKLNHNSTNKPFQKLLILIRDWFSPYEAPYGFGGGNEILQRVFDKTNPEKKEIQQNIKENFEEITCFLMPFPGDKVATDPYFQGSLDDIKPNFLKGLEVLVPNVLSPEKLITKQDNGTDITAQEFPQYIESSFSHMFNHSVVPMAKPILSATAESQNLAAIDETTKFYQRNMETKLPDSYYVTEEELNAIHRECFESARNQFNAIPKVQSTTDYEKKLQDCLQNEFNYYKLRNEQNRPNIPSIISDLLNAVTRVRTEPENFNDDNTETIIKVIDRVSKSGDQYNPEIKKATVKISTEGNFAKGIKLLKSILPVIREVLEIALTVATLTKAFKKI